MNIYEQSEHKIVKSQEEEPNPKVLNKRPLSLGIDSSFPLGLVTSASAGNISIEDSEEIVTIAKPIIELEQKSTKKEFRLSLKDLPPLPDVQKVMNNSHNNRQSLSIELSHDTHENKGEDDFISAKMVKRWNNEVGKMDVPEKALKTINKMRRLGGLDPSDSPLNIPTARKGLCLLAELKCSHDLKMYALESLLTILKNDDFSKENSYLLVDLAIDLLHLIDREAIQTVDLDTEIKLTEVYRVLAESLHIHAGKKHFNGITAEVKANLISAANSILRLNRLDNVKIRYNIACAREYLRWLKDDTQELYVIAERLYNIVLAGGALYFEDAEEGFRRLEMALKTKDPHLPKHPWHWHTALSVVNALARDVKSIELNVHNHHHNHNHNHSHNLNNNNNNIKESKNSIQTEKKNAVTNSENLLITEKKGITIPLFDVLSMNSKTNSNRTNSKFKVSSSEYKTSTGKSDKRTYHNEIVRLLTLIGKKYAKLDWKFSYGAIETLFDLVLTGKTAEIRMQAFKGVSFRENADHKNTKVIVLPGLKHFASCKALDKKLKNKQLIHLELPEYSSQNKIIRECCVERLIDLIKKSKDEAIRKKAENLLRDRALYENFAPIRLKIEDFFNENLIEYSPRKKERKLSIHSS